jgi:N-acetylglutamate synthase-like GNAT family acetyltransferase
MGAGVQFSEKDFYLAEFRARTVGISLPEDAGAGAAELDTVLGELAANQTRVILLGTAFSPVLKERVGEPLSDADSGWMGALWRVLSRQPCAALQLSPASTRMAARCGEVALRLGLIKLVWIDPRGGLMHPGGQRRSFVDLKDLDALLLPLDGDARDEGVSEAAESPERLALLRDIRAMLAAGIPAVNLCTLAGLEDELFSYEGSGTLFTCQRYTDVRWLALDEFAAAHDLVGRGVAEGYLVQRSPESLDRLLSNAFGVFVEGRYLAGIGSLFPSLDGRAGEIGSLYTLTRFIGDGVGTHLIGFALAAAAACGFDFVYACTTAPRVENFFLRHGFRRVEAEALPAEKWRGYSAERRAEVRCLRRDVEHDPGAPGPNS